MLRCDCSQILSSEIPPHCMQDILVIQQCVLATVHTHFTWWKLLMLKQIPLTLADLVGKIFTLPHSSGNDKTDTLAWLSAFSMNVIAGLRLHVFGNYSKLSHHLNSVASLQLFDFFQTPPDNFQDISQTLQAVIIIDIKPFSSSIDLGSITLCGFHFVGHFHCHLLQLIFGNLLPTHW